MGKLVIFIVLPLILLIGAAGGAFVMGIIPGFGGEVVEEAEPTSDLPPAYAAVPKGATTHTLPEFVVNLQTKRTYPVFLLLSLTVEVPSEGARGVVSEQEPRIRDSMIVYLSSLKPQDLNGYDGVQKVRENAWKVLKEHVDRDNLLNVHVSKLTVK